MQRETVTQLATPPGMHVAIIMDGNGRWATARRRPRTFGHRAGAKAVRRVVEAAPDLGIGVLTLYAFSSDNWARPALEVKALMGLFHQYLLSETDELMREGVRLQVIGRRDRLPPAVVNAVRAAEERTRRGTKLLLRVAVDYSARDAIVGAAQRAVAGASWPAGLDRNAFAYLMGEALHENCSARDVDLLIRTGGERRLSDFLLWECAYAELYFTDLMWPDFGSDELANALIDFRSRQRRFGGVPNQAVG
jgi:undecaprenyl diphosphate synthase